MLLYLVHLQCKFCTPDCMNCTLLCLFFKQAFLKHPSVQDHLNKLSGSGVQAGFGLHSLVLALSATSFMSSIVTTTPFGFCQFGTLPFRIQSSSISTEVFAAFCSKQYPLHFLPSLGGSSICSAVSSRPLIEHFQAK